MNPFLLAVVLHAAPSDLAPEGVAFADAAQKARHAALRKWMEAHSKGFRHQPLRAAGNFLTERWCSPAVAAAACEGGAVTSATARGTAYRTLEALHYQWPDAFGLVLAVGDLPAKGELGVRLALSEGGQSIVGDGFAVTWLRFDGDAVAEELSLGSQAALRVGTAELSTAPLPWRDVLSRLRRSPESLAAFAQEQLAALEARVAEAFAKGEVQGFDEAPYEGRGLPPRRTPRPLTKDEEQRARTDAKAELERRRRFVARAAKVMHARLDALPVDVLLAPQKPGR